MVMDLLLVGGRGICCGCFESSGFGSAGCCHALGNSLPVISLATLSLYRDTEFLGRLQASQTQIPVQAVHQ